MDIVLTAHEVSVVYNMHLSLPFHCMCASSIWSLRIVLFLCDVLLHPCMILTDTFDNRSHNKQKQTPTTSNCRKKKTISTLPQTTRRTKVVVLSSSLYLHIKWNIDKREIKTLTTLMWQDFYVDGSPHRCIVVNIAIAYGDGSNRTLLEIYATWKRLNSY